MAYVDLNPVRAGIAEIPEDSEYTSIKARIEGDYRESTLTGPISRLMDRQEINHFRMPVRPLMRFSDESDDTKRPSLPMKQREYLKLVDQTGRIAVHGKRGRIDASLEPILDRLGLMSDDWLRCSTAFRRNVRNGELRIARSA